jgi:hypothetical protein
LGRGHKQGERNGFAEKKIKNAEKKKSKQRRPLSPFGPYVLGTHWHVPSAVGTEPTGHSSTQTMPEQMPDAHSVPLTHGKRSLVLHTLSERALVCPSLQTQASSSTDQIEPSVAGQVQALCAVWPPVVAPLVHGWQGSIPPGPKASLAQTHKPSEFGAALGPHLGAQRPWEQARAAQSVPRRQGSSLRSLQTGGLSADATSGATQEHELVDASQTAPTGTSHTQAVDP